MNGSSAGFLAALFLVCCKSPAPPAAGSLSDLLLDVPVVRNLPGEKPPDPSEADPGEPPGVERVDITECAGRLGAPAAVPGNVATPHAALDPENNYFTWLSNERPSRVVMTHFDGKACTPALRINEIDQGPVNWSHDAPSIHVDGAGYVYATYFGSVIFENEGLVEAPYIRRTTRPGGIDAWGPEMRARLFNTAELHSVRLHDGALLLAGSDLHARIDIIEPGGEYRWPAARQVVTQDITREGSNDGRCRGNRFTKAVFHQDPDPGGPLYVLWGWGGGGDLTPRPAGCEDVRHYSDDSHELFFAYSTDGGETWSNADGTKRVAAPFCRDLDDCRDDPTKGIRHNDPAFAVTSMRHREHRKLWAERDGTIYVAFAKSTWCDAGTCTSRRVTDPGALTVIRFRPGGEVEQVTVNRESHYYIGGIRKEGDGLFVWAGTDAPWRVYEYASYDDGKSWTRTLLHEGDCNRLHGKTLVPDLESSVRMTFACQDAGQQRIHFYRRTF